MAERKTEIDDLLAKLRRCAAEGLRVGIAVGAFALIHAGTVRFLRRARERCDRLFVAIVPQRRPPEGSGKAENLLRPDERRRILAMMEEVDGALLLDRPEDLDADAWRRAAPDAAWMWSEAENDLDPPTREEWSRQGLEPEPISDGQEGCTTRLLLERLAR